MTAETAEQFSPATWNTPASYRRLRLWLILAIAVALVVIAAALNKPWSGMVFSAETPWRISAVEAESPAARAGIQPGWTLVAIGTDRARLALQPADRPEDPDMLFYAPAIRQFYERQTLLFRQVASGPVELSLADSAGAPRTATVAFERTPFTSLGLLFWSQWLAGLGCLILAIWILAAQRRALPAKLLFLSAAGVALAIWPSAIYTTREVAIDGTLFRLLSLANGLGITLFAFAFAALLLVYPRRLVPPWIAFAFVAIPMLAIACELAGIVDDTRWSRTFLVALGLFMGLVLALLQWFASRTNPLDRAAMRWIFLSLLASLVFFTAVGVLPTWHGYSLSMPQGYMMSFALVFFGGLAVAVARYRLFAIEAWSHRLLFYLVGALLLFLVDLALVGALHLAGDAAFGIALLAVSFIYLPLRGTIWRRFTSRKPLTSPSDAFSAVTSIALEPSAAERGDQWRQTLRRCFQPMTLMPATEDVAQTTIANAGLTLMVPPSTAGPGVVLHHKSGGRTLFQPEDKRLVDGLILFMESVNQRRDAFAQGATAERLRIARDLHDDVGAKLLSAMHHSDERVRSILQDTLSDIRTLTGALAGEVVPLGQLMAEIRHEAAQRLMQQNIALDWPPLPDEAPDRPMDFRQRKALSSSIREVITNVLKHARADTVRVTVEDRDDLLTVTVSDDGSGIAEQPGKTAGAGLHNIDHRIRDVGGSARFDWSPQGLTVTLTLPAVSSNQSSPASGEGAG